MGRTAKRSSLILYVLIILFSQCAIAQQTFSYGSFGKLSMYAPKGKPNALVLFVSGDGGRSLRVSTLSTMLPQWHDQKKIVIILLKISSSSAWHSKRNISLKAIRNPYW